MSSDSPRTSFEVAVYELLWGCQGDGTREPFSADDSLARLKEFSDKALAWDNMVEAHSSDSENDWVITELMDDILKEVKE